MKKTDAVYCNHALIPTYGLDEIDLPTPKTTIRLVFPHQLFVEHTDAPGSTHFVIIEDDLYFRQYRFHKQKLVLHRASMRMFAERLKQAGYDVAYLETSFECTSMDQLRDFLAIHQDQGISYYDVVDDWLERRLATVFRKLDKTAERLITPAFLTSPGQIEDYFAEGPRRMQQFYEWQRKRLNIMLDDNGKPIGGKWSYDVANRKKLPKSVAVAPPYPALPKPETAQVVAARAWVDAIFPDNPGSTDTYDYPITHASAEQRLQRFTRERLGEFGPYEDALSVRSDELFHSVLSPLLNIGLLSPQHVIEYVLNYAEHHDVPIESLEGFIRQIIGWREYMRATYIRDGRQMRTSNHLAADRPLAAGWWDGSTGIGPVDESLQKVLRTAYAHHIERLMVFGNAMTLLRISPDDVYEWFMTMFIDAYDWVMVPNVYAMSQFAAGPIITTKPYISGSNYLRKMSDFTTGDWMDVWDALYWQFIADKRTVLQSNFRMQMVLRLYDKMNPETRQKHQALAAHWLTDKTTSES